jgi:hypothetical protein
MKEFSIRKNGWRTAGALLLALFPFCAAPYAQDSSPVHYVNVSNTTPVAPFTNWETAAIHIQDAILFANNGDTVVVTNGAYNERIDFMGKAIVVSSEEGPSATIIDGNQSGSVVSFSGGEGTNSIIQGFTITNGYATQGGGIYCTNASPGITNCVITGNSTFSGINTPWVFRMNGGDGGGIYASSNSHPVIADCVISNNTTGDGVYENIGNGGNGGGIFCYSATIVRSLISGNSTGWASVGNGGDGGGIWCNSAIIRNSNIQGNATRSATYPDAYPRSGDGGRGGGLYCSGSTVVERSTISANTTGSGCFSDQWAGGDGGDGGGIYAADGSPEFLHCDIVGNSTGDGGIEYDYSYGRGGDGGDGAGLYASGACVPTLSSCSFLTNATGNGGNACAYVSGPGFGGRGGDGGGVYAVSDATIQSCLFIANITGNGGNAGLYWNFDGNGGRGGNGGGLWSTGAVAVANCTIWRNTVGYGGSGGPAPYTSGAHGFGGGIWCVNGVVVNCILWNDAFGEIGGWNFQVAYSDVESGSGGTGNISSEPMFTNAAAGDYHLLPSSPCVNRGINQDWMTNATDLDGNPRICCGVVDLGAFELNMVCTVLISSQPTNQTVAVGGTATLTVFATGSPPLYYLWCFGSSPVAGGTGPSLVLSNVQPSQAGSYSVVVSNAYGSVTSSIVLLAVPGSVVAWGDNTYGQCKVPGGLMNIVAIAAGFSNSLALSADGTAIGWGQNDFGQTNPPVRLSNVTAIAAGWGTSLALKSDRTLEEWGWDGGYGLKATAEALTNIISVSALWDCGIALKSDHTVFVWGKSTHEETNVPAGLTDVVAVSGGGYFCMALKGDGTVVTWGSNFDGQTNTPADLSNLVAIAAGGHHCLALKRDGTVVAWGADYYGHADVPPDLTNAVAVSAGCYHSLALRADGTLVAWGLGSSGQTNIPPCLYGVTAISAGGYHNLALVAGTYPMQFSDVKYLPNGQVQFTVRGLPRDVFRVLASTNLLDWQTNCCVTNYSGSVQFIDTQATNYSRRFYRSVAP